MQTLETHAGVEIPRVVYGTAWKKARTAGLVEQALRAGFRGVDTACQPKHYDEPGVGVGLERAFAAGASREGVFVQTKFTPLDGHDERVPYDPAAPLAAQVAQSLETSLRNLPVSTIDSLILHSPLRRMDDTMTVWRAMEAAHAAGKVRQLGISNCYAPEVFERLFDESSVKPAVLQNRFYRESGFDVVLRRYCLDRGIAYQSFWTLSANRELLESRAVRAAAAARGWTAAQVLYRALTQIDVVPLIGTTSAAHMRDDLAIFDDALSRDEMTSIRATWGEA